MNFKKIRGTVIMVVTSFLLGYFHSAFLEASRISSAKYQVGEIKMERVVYKDFSFNNYQLYKIAIEKKSLSYLKRLFYSVFMPGKTGFMDKVRNLTITDVNYKSLRENVVSPIFTNNDSLICVMQEDSCENGISKMVNVCPSLQFMQEELNKKGHGEFLLILKDGDSAPQMIQMNLQGRTIKSAVKMRPETHVKFKGIVLNRQNMSGCFPILVDSVDTIKYKFK